MHVQARALWLAGDTNAQQQANVLWTQVSNDQGNDSIATARLDLAKCLALVARGQDRDVIANLESLRKSQEHSAVGIEAAIELALVYAKAARRDDALSCLDGATKQLEMAESYGIPKPVADAFAHGIRRARETIDNPAKAAFMRAQALQRAGHFARAMAAFGQVSRDFPGTEEDHRSQFEIGACHLGLADTQKAIDHWRQFTTAAPAGPWRGHAFVILIDLALCDRLDLDAGHRLAEQSKVALESALAADNAKASWQLARYDLALRRGIIDLCRDHAAAAVEAFREARAAASDLGQARNLVRLTAAAESHRGIIPADCRATAQASSKASLTKSRPDSELAEVAVQLGMAFHLGGLDHRAIDAFERVLGRPGTAGSRGKAAQPAVRGLAGATPAHAAFAAYGKGMVLDSLKKPDAAHKAYLASLRLHGDGSWHDETLFRLGNLTASPAEALPYWTRLIDGFPKSPRKEIALYRAGILLADHTDALSKKAAGRGAQTAREVDRAWQDAEAMLSWLTEAFPKSPYAAEAYVKQIDMALERRFDLAAASAAARKAIAWCEEPGDGLAAVEAAQVTVLPPWAVIGSDVPAGSSRNVETFRIHVAAGLIAHFEGDDSGAIAHFKKASTLEASHRKEIGAETAMDRMIAVVEGRGPAFSPHDFLKGLRDVKQRTAVLLADLSLLTFDPERAGAIYERILAAEPPFAAPPAELEAYVMLRLGQALEFQRRHDEAVAILERLYEPKYAKFPWASDGIFRLGTWSHNATQDPAKAMPHWEHVFTKTPNHPEAERSLFYFGLTAAEAGEHGKAVQAYRKYLERYPDSRWTKRVRNHELPEATRLLEESTR
jgi:tetratricopeptide (TPR) repeat protein